MSVPIQILAALAVLTNAVVYGTDTVAALVTRSVHRRLDDTTMTLSAGWGHYYADLRMPPIGITGLVSALLATVLAGVGGYTVPAVSAGLSVLALVAWLVLYARIAKPVNTAQKAAAQTGTIPPDARALQERWDSILHPRVGLQMVALIALLVTIATA
ncbi:DUF1772 domain-containing protein [Nocardia sp. CDC159]|uniref:DUF1772 domain-containing protein n=1 Tax=Nocardia pulmonis TaxID=2951408 RepID=A0A9X2E693_9NOCA|nr:MULTISPECIES: DUF1772 domain-containing protein [Nocardia]MCM6773898.1 DUF1772 domain-containing protein [Nocardia pulmonis]MCM6786785.1 DUF1772 domain-containing protein [Nocardia sp. CDC159]